MSISIVVASDGPLESGRTSRELNRHGENFHVVASAHTSKEILQEVSGHQPDVALVSKDLQGEPNGGLKALRKLCASCSTTRPIILVDSPEPELVISVFAAGARGVVSMSDPIGVLCDCIRRVHAGELWTASDQLEWIVKTLVERDPIHVDKAEGTPSLTQREQQIVCMVAEGFPNTEISSSLGVSPHTVKNHLFRIYEKLGVSNRVELLFYALSSREEKGEMIPKAVSASGACHCAYGLVFSARRIEGA